ncbi:MAG TPA: glycosyltransferase family 4 protein [Prolixibacteraceae bacterium]|jgi:UDP-N-acetylmuramyl pentapeptide phosphotransferase/UDP-N-acetylglucosamine-1-phosphate transferase
MNYSLILIALLASELAYFQIADRFNIIDRPNQRSSHSKITIQGGGIIFYISILLYFAHYGCQYPWFFWGVSLITLMSFADDNRPQPTKLRLSIHFIAMALMFYQWGLFYLPWYDTLLALVFFTGILNAFNFMDGINGITGGYSLVVAGALCYINFAIVPFVDMNLIYVLILALLVFNFFNFRTKARCFAGDTGAFSVAFILIFLLGRLIIKTGDFSYIILLVVYGIDTVLTIIHRLILKKNIFKAHRKHAFQLMANELKIPHVIVALFYASLQAVIAVGFFVFKSHSYVYFGIVILTLSLLYVLFTKKYFHLHQFPLSNHSQGSERFVAVSIRKVKKGNKQTELSHYNVPKL